MNDTLKDRKKSSIIEKLAGHSVTNTSIWIIAAIVFALLVEIVLVETKFSAPDLPQTFAQLCGDSCDKEAIIRLAMEQDAQMLRTDRVRTTMVSRLMIFVIAEIVALLLVALGAVLIFNRIEGSKGDTTINYGKLFFSTSFPGLGMCAIGAAVIAFSLYLASVKGMLITVYDRPVYTEDLNLTRNAFGYFSGQEPTQEDADTPEKASAQQPDIADMPD